MPSNELRRLLLDAGLAVLYRRGLRATANHVPVSEALAELEATRGLAPAMGSIFGAGRPWRSVKDFQLDLLLAALGDQRQDGPNDESLRLVAGIEDQRVAPAEQRLSTLAELCRIAGHLNGYVPERGKERTWTMWLAIWTMAMSDTEQGEVLRQPLLEAHDYSLRSFTSLYSLVLDRLGLCIRPPYTLHQFAVAAAALTDGLALRVGISNSVIGPVRSAHDDQEWNLMGVGLLALTHEFVGVDPAAG